MLLIKRSMKSDEAKLLQAKLQKAVQKPKAPKCYPAVVCDATCYLDVLPHQSTPPTAPRRRIKTQINIFYCDAFTLIVDINLHGSISSSYFGAFAGSRVANKCPRALSAAVVCLLSCLLCP